MAVTVTQVTNRQSVGQYFEKLVDIQLDNSYATNGVALTPAQLGFGEVLQVLPEETAGAAARSFVYDRANQKLLAYAPAGAEVANATDLSAVTVRTLVRGR